MRTYREFLPTAPEELGIFVGLKTAASMDPFPKEGWGKRACALIGCYNGLATEGGTEGLGRSTTATVVQVAMGVIISDFFLTKLFLFLFW